MTGIMRRVLKGLLSPFFYRIVNMPGRSFNGAIPQLGPDEKRTKDELFKHIQMLSDVIPDRSLDSPGLEAAAQYIVKSFQALGYSTRSQVYELRGKNQRNIEAILPGTTHPERIIVLGAHYDTVPGTPGADDNASGVAALLELARLFAGKPLPVTLRFVAFTNEETYNYETMGSYQYAQECRKNNDNIIGMFSLEMLGSFSDEEGTQNYPFPFNIFYPSKGNFIAFVGNTASRDFLRKSIASFRRLCQFPSEGCAAPAWVSDASRSDHLAFWKFGYPALMLTDTSNFRYEHYHGDSDTIDKLDFDRMTLVVSGFSRVIEDLAATSE